MPYAAAGLFAADPNAQTGCMQHQRKLMEALDRAQAYLTNHKTGATNRKLLVLLKDMQWQNWQISLEALATAKEGRYSTEDTEIRKMCVSIHAGQSNSKFTAEDIFNHLQHISQRSQKGCAKMNKQGPQFLAYHRALLLMSASCRQDWLYCRNSPKTMLSGGRNGSTARLPNHWEKVCSWCSPSCPTTWRQDPWRKATGLDAISSLPLTFQKTSACQALWQLLVWDMSLLHGCLSTALWCGFIRCHGEPRSSMSGGCQAPKRIWKWFPQPWLCSTALASRTLTTAKKCGQDTVPVNFAETIGGVAVCQTVAVMLVRWSGCLMMKGAVLLSATGKAYLCVGFRSWLAMGVALKQHNIDGKADANSRNRLISC